MKLDQDLNEESTFVFDDLSGAEDELAPTVQSAGDMGLCGDESQPAKRLRREAQSAAETTNFVFEDLSGAEDEHAPTGHAAGASAAPNNISVLSEEALADMVKLMNKWEPTTMTVLRRPHLRRLAF